MNINKLVNQSEVKKQVFKYKRHAHDGLILQVHHTIQKNKQEQRIRFVHAAFDKQGQILAAADFAGNIFLVNFIHSKFWVLPSINSCTAIKFSIFNESEVIVGVTNGNLYVINTESGEIVAEWASHTQAVQDISFSHDFMCLTASRNEAIVWNLKANTRIQVLSLNSNCVLKFVFFMPITSDILACFDDETILIWKHETFEMCKQIEPTPWDKQMLRSIAFTRNGRAMVFGGHSSQLTVFMLDTWTIYKTVTLPQYIPAIKRIDFIPQLFDGGANKVLIVLANSGKVYFYDIEQETVLNQIVADDLVVRFDCSTDGKYVACVLRSGEVNIYTAGYYIPQERSTSVTKEKRKTSSVATIQTKKSLHILESIQKQMQEVLATEKLQAILKEFGQYPDAYRLKIWTQLLELPNNMQQYNTFNNQMTQSSFESLTQDYPLENKIALKNLRKLLCNLVTWCPYFSQVDYLPIFVFPFVKVFQNEPVLCFEAAVTILLNWCQHWFEYFPLPPVNILAMIENLLLEHDSKLLQHLATNNITSKLYAWPLLEAAFSEVLSSVDWCKLWDHILTNEPAFFLMCVTAYNIIHRKTLLSINTLAEFEYFYHNQNVTSIRNLISKTYALLKSTSDKNHPRLYLIRFKKIERGSYPTFIGFPNVMIDFNTAELHNLKKEKALIEKEAEELVKAREARQEELEKMQKEQVHIERLKDLEDECQKRVIAECNRVKEQRERLVDLRKQLQEEERDILHKSRNAIIDKNNKQRRRKLERLLSNVEQTRKEEEVEIAKAEGELMKQYSNLLLNKMKLEEALNTEDTDVGPMFEYKHLKRQQMKLAEVVQNIQKESESVSHLKNLNIATGLAAMDDLIVRIEMELAKETAEGYEDFNKTHSSLKVLKLESETRQLEMEVSKLLALLADVKSTEAKEKIWDLRDSIRNRKEPFLPSSNIYVKQQETRDFQDRVSSISSVNENYGKIKKLIGCRAHDGDIQRTSSLSTAGKESLSSEEIAVISLGGSSR